MKVLISADSVCDLPEELIKKYNFKIMPIIITMDDKEFQDGIDVGRDDLFAYVERTGNLPKTAARSSYEYGEFFENLLTECDHVIHFSLSFKISSTGNNARIAAEQIGNNKVTVIDSATLTTGVGMLMIECAKKVQEGKEIANIVSEIEELKSKIQVSFLVDTLKYLHKGGRCSSLALLGANLLKIKPRISLIDGAMQVTKKYMGGIDSCMLKYIRDLLIECPPASKEYAFVTFSSDMQVKEKIVDYLKEQGFETVLESYAGPTICTHCGKNTMGIVYIKQ